jgi:PAS domain S-box-containing protein
MRFLPRHLNHRTTLLVAIILCVTGIISGWLGAARQSDRLVASMGDHAAIMVRHFAENCARFLVLEDYAELETFLLKSAELPNVTHLLVCEPDGRIVGDISQNRAGELVSAEGSRKIPPPSGTTPSHAISGETLTFWQPITSGKLLGWIRADFSLASIRQAQLVTWRQNLGLALIWVIVSASLILIILRPTAVVLGKLTLFARSLHECKGNQIEVHHDTIEIEALEEALNYASTRLLTTERQLISDRERLAKSEENYRQLLDTIQEGIWVIDQHAITTFVNPRMAEILGYAPEEMLGRHLFTFMDDQGRAVAEQNIERRKAGIKEQHDFEFIRKDGNRIYTRLETGPIFDHDGVYVGSIAAVADITARKEAEARVQESEERLRLTLEATRIGIWDWDVQNDQWYASPVYYTMLGYPPEPGPADRNAWLERVHPDDRALVAKKIQDVLTRDFKSYQYEARIRHADGSYRWQQVQGFGMRRDADGKVTRMLGIRMDIHERKIAERQLETLNADLDQRVQERTTELQEKNEELERLNRIFVGRELRMVELKERIKELEKQESSTVS